MEGIGNSAALRLLVACGAAPSEVERARSTGRYAEVAGEAMGTTPVETARVMRHLSASALRIAEQATAHQLVRVA